MDLSHILPVVVPTVSASRSNTEGTAHMVVPKHARAVPACNANDQPQRQRRPGPVLPRAAGPSFGNGRSLADSAIGRGRFVDHPRITVWHGSFGSSAPRALSDADFARSARSFFAIA